MSYRFCPACRSANEADAAFCGICGARLDDQVAAAMPQQPYPGAAAPAYGQPVSAYVPQPGPAPGGPQAYGAAGYAMPVPPDVARVLTAAQAAGLFIPAGTFPASFWIRFRATLIDGIILSIVQYSLTTTIGLWAYLVPVLYSIAFWALKGQTPGKMLFRLQVVSTDGTPMTWGKATMRYLGYMASAATLGIGFLAILFDDARRGLHDRIAKTAVVRRL